MSCVNSPLSRVILVSASAFTFGAPALAASLDYFLKLPPIEGDSGKAEAQDDKHKNQIEILSWSWGDSRAGTYASGDTEAAAGKVSKVDAISIKQSTHAAPGEAEITLKGNSGTGQAAAKTTPPTVTLKRGTSAAAAGVQVAAGDVTGDGAAASGVPTGKRQHKPFVLTRPLDKGSVLLNLKSAWADCRVGARYPKLELGGGGKTYLLTDATVTSCSAAGDRPMESISLNYTKIEF
jgi:type VI protein secretion system component Hcp